MPIGYADVRQEMKSALRKLSHRGAQENSDFASRFLGVVM